MPIVIKGLRKRLEDMADSVAITTGKNSKDAARKARAKVDGKKERRRRKRGEPRDWERREAKRQKEEAALIRRSDGRKPLSQRLKEFARGDSNFSRMEAKIKAERKKVKKNKNREATQRNARNKAKHA